MPELKLRLTGNAERGRDIYKAIRTQIWQCRAKGIEPKCVWIGTDTANHLHAMWDALAKYFDHQLPRVIAGVKQQQGFGLGRADFVIEYHDDAKTNEAALKPLSHDPLPDHA